MGIEVSKGALGAIIGDFDNDDHAFQNLRGRVVSRSGLEFFLAGVAMPTSGHLRPLDKLLAMLTGKACR